MAFYMKNLHGTSDLKCSKCGSWLEHWEKYTGRAANQCAVCGEHANVGGHVIFVSGDDRSTYIVPLCFRCNAKTEPFLCHESLVRALQCD